MKVGILGSGNVGQALGLGFAGGGHVVMIGSRRPESKELKAWKAKAGGNGRTGTFPQAAAHGEILVLAVLGTAVEDVLRIAGPEKFSGKLVVDATNPLDFSDHGAPGLFVGMTDSLGERVQRSLPKAKVVKAFNTVPSVLMVNPKLPGGHAEMLICGKDAGAKRQVTKILRDFGWSGAVDVGGIESARWLEALVPLWVRVSNAVGTWNQCFQIARA